MRSSRSQLLARDIRQRVRYCMGGMPTSREKRSAKTERDKWTSLRGRQRSRVLRRGGGDILYHNPDDPAVFVPKRYSGGWTVNFGHPLGKLVMIATLLLALVLAILKASSQH